MFEQWKKSQFEKKLSKRFPHLKISWKDLVLEVTPSWGDSSNGGYEYQTRFRIYRNFLDDQHLSSIIHIIAEAFDTPRRREEDWQAPVVELNSSTLESSVYIKKLFSSDLDSISKILLAISGRYSVISLGLETTLQLLERKIMMRANELIDPSIDRSLDLINQSLLIFPGIETHFEFNRPISEEQIDHFFASDDAINLALFLSLESESELTFKNFYELSENSILTSPRSERAIRLCSADLIVALEIFQNSPREQIDRLTTSQLLSLAKEMYPGQASAYPMSLILKRLKDTSQLFMPEFEKRSEIKCLDVLNGFINDEELSSLENEANEYSLTPRLNKFFLFQRHGNTDPLSLYGNTSSPILAVLTEIAVIKGVRRYVEVVDFLQSTFPNQRMNWETIDPIVRTNLLNLIAEVFKEEYDDIPFKWVVPISDYSPFDVGRRCYYENGKMIYMRL